MKRISVLTLLATLTLLASATGNIQYGKIYDMLKGHASESLTTLADGYYARNAMDSALVCYSIISARYTQTMEQKQKWLCAHAANRCGAIHYFRSDYTKALQTYIKALEICKESGYKSYISRTYNNIGNIYSMFHDYQHAKEYYRQAFELSSPDSDKELLNVILNNLIGVSCELNIDDARKYLDSLKALKLPENASYNYYLYTTYGIIDKWNQQYESALKYYRLSVHYAKDSKAPGQNTYASYFNISQIFSHLKQYDSALIYLNNCVKIAKDNGYLNYLVESYQSLSDIYRLMGNEKQELAYKKKYLYLNDSIFNMKEFGKIKDIQSLYEIEKIEKHVKELADEQTINRNRINSQQQIMLVIGITFAIIASLLIYLYFQYRKLNETNSSLFNRNIEIMGSEKEERKRRLIYEERLREKDTMLAAWKQQYGDKAGQAETENQSFADNADEDAAGSKMKYQNSTLDETDKVQLQEAIEKVMSDSNEFCSMGFSLEKLSLLVDSRPKYVSQTINEIYGKNFNTFLNEYRIREARNRLTDTAAYGNYSIAGISESVGFKSKANFNMVFKKITGFTPSDYQKMAKTHSV